MKAWRLSEPNTILLEEMESQPVGESCLKLKILYCSIAPTDRLLYQGKIKAEYPLILGRQATAMVVEIGESVKNFTRGDIVCIKPMTACSHCNKCAENKYNECENMLTFGINEDGFLSDFAVVSALDAVKLPERVSAKDAVFADYIEMAIETIDRTNLEKGQYLVIAGATESGIILAQVAMYYQVVPILIDINPVFLEKASQAGIYYAINSAEVETKKRIFSLTGGKMADACAYMADSNYPFNPILDFVKKRGSVAVCGLRQSRPELNGTFTQMLNRELTVFGIGESNNTAGAINMLANKAVDVTALYAAEVPFEAVGKEFMKEPDAHSLYLKTIVKI